MYIVTTTHITRAERQDRVVARNKVALELAEELGLGVIDLYDVTVKNPELIVATEYTLPPKDMQN